MKIKPKYVIVDTEADGPAAGLFSMTEIGAVIMDEPPFVTSFYGKLKPISDKWVPEALAVTHKTREDCMKFDDPFKVMCEFQDWLAANIKGQPIFISDNPCFDWQNVNYYFHKFIGKNPFGFSGRRIGDFYCGLTKDYYAKWKWMRTTAHTHNPVDDARGNAEALYRMIKEHNIKL